ncbi:MAG: hypothetical protein JSR98_22120 [Proteobacteria bacterium]|nr:hypothetical protein [Pseudomonadota bacterium]
MLSKFFKPKGPRGVAEGQAVTPAKEPLQIIGQETLRAAHDPTGKVLLYAEVEDGVISADIFSRAASEKVRFRFGPQALKSLIYSYWEAENGPSGRWATMCMIIDGGRFKVSFEYPDALEPGEETHERRPKVIHAHFGDTPVDYSSPN